MAGDPLPIEGSGSDVIRDTVATSINILLLPFLEIFKKDVNAFV